MPAFAVLSWASKLIANTAQQRAAEEKTTRATIFSELLICSIVRREFEVDSKLSKPELSHSESVCSEINTIQGGGILKRLRSKIRICIRVELKIVYLVLANRRAHSGTWGSHFSYQYPCFWKWCWRVIFRPNISSSYMQATTAYFLVSKSSDLSIDLRQNGKCSASASRRLSQRGERSDSLQGKTVQSNGQQLSHNDMTWSFID